jgi:hypothetical protein
MAGARFIIENIVYNGAFPTDLRRVVLEMISEGWSK